MKLKMKLMAAAVALTASMGANAAMDNFASGNSSLAFIALDSVGSPISAMMDLDFNLNSFLPAAMATPGTKIEWNFGSNTLSINGVVQSGRETNWGSAYSTFMGTAQTTDIKWGVIAGDSKNALQSVDGSPVRYLTTVVGGTALDYVDNQTNVNLGGFSIVDNMVSNQSTAQSGGLNGSTATSGTGYVGAQFGLGTASSRGWQNKLSTGVIGLANYNTSADFYLMTVTGTSGVAGVQDYAGTFGYNAGVLTYEVAAAIPEPSEYALMLAGLGMLGFMARRRLSNRV